MKRSYTTLGLAAAFLAAGCKEDNGQAAARVDELERVVNNLEQDNRDLTEKLEKETDKEPSPELAELREEVRNLNRTIGSLQTKADQYDAAKAECDRLRAQLAERANKPPVADATPPPPAAPAAAPTAGSKGSGLLDADGKVRPEIADAVVLIEGDNAVGSGFFAKSNDNIYLYTAAHVISGNTKLTVTNTAGRKFTKFGKMEVATDADLVRIQMDEPVDRFLKLASGADSTAVNTEIAALGNGGGGGVTAVENGMILGSSGNQLEIDAGVIQGNSGGPVVVAATGDAVGVVTHLKAGRSDIWAEGTRQAEVRRFACRVDTDRKWVQIPVGVFLADGRKVSAYDELTLLGFAFSQLESDVAGLRYDSMRYGSRAPLEIIGRNKNLQVVKELMDFNSGLASGRIKLGQADRKKKIASFLASMKYQLKQGADQLRPEDLNPYHRTNAQRSIQAREECLSALDAGLARAR